MTHVAPYAPSAPFYRQRLPRMAAVAALSFVILGLSVDGLSPHANVPPTPITVPQAANAPAVTAPHTAVIAAVRTEPSHLEPGTAFNGTHILSPEDAAFYRAAFAAQETSDWATADAALAKTRDKRLTGHVLADRYLHRGITLAEAQGWFASYADLPEAATLYTQAKNLHGFAALHLTRPANAANWGGARSFGGSYGFKPAAANDNARINAALRRGDPLAARELLSSEWQHGTLSARDAGDSASRIAAAFYYDGQIARARATAHIASEVKVPLGLWIEGLSAWKQQDFADASRIFAGLAQSPNLAPWDHAAAAYWAYRAATRNGDAAGGRFWLADAARTPDSFYGMMAASLSGHRPARSWKLPELTAHNVETLARTPAGWQSLALLQVGRNDLAENELRRVNPTGNAELETATLALAEKARMPSLTVQAGSLATHDNGQLYDAAQYPVPPWQPASGFKIDRALLFALMKRESQFDPEAVSASGACGLMQIMPSTARQISGNTTSGSGASNSDCADQLFDPATNMELGQKYVRVLAGQPMIGDNLMLLLASYNGGPGNVAHWLDAETRKDPLLFLESLPLRETHDYVQQVLMHYWMYRSRLAEPENSVAQLARGEWPRIALRDTGIAPVLLQAQADTLEMASAGR